MQNPVHLSFYFKANTYTMSTDIGYVPKLIQAVKYQTTNNSDEGNSFIWVT